MQLVTPTPSPVDTAENVAIALTLSAALGADSYADFIDFYHDNFTPPTTLLSRHATPGDSPQSDALNITFAEDWYWILKAMNDVNTAVAELRDDPLESAIYSFSTHGAPYNRLITLMRGQ